MSEFEKINASAKVQMSERRKIALKRTIVVMSKVLLALAALFGLTAIGFISKTFLAILIVSTLCVGAFNAGYIYRDIKF